MAERGAVPQVSRARKGALRVVRSLFSPLLPDDYLELINPLWSTRELRGRIERIEPETADAATVVDQARLRWDGPRARASTCASASTSRAPPLARVLADVRARAARTAASRSRSRTSTRASVSPYLVRDARPGAIVSPRRRRGRLRAPRGAAREAAVHQRGQRDHADHEHAAQPRHRDALDDVVLLHSARTQRRRDLRRASCASSTRHDGCACTSSTPASTAGSSPPTSTSCARTGASARRSSRAPASMLDALERALGARRRLRPPPHGALPAQARLGGEEGEGGTIVFLKQRLRGRERRLQADPRGRRGGRARPALRLPRGHLPHLRRDAALRARCATCATARSAGRRARRSAPASTPPRAASRSNSEPTGGTAWTTAHRHRRELENPLHS